MLHNFDFFVNFNISKWVLCHLNNALPNKADEINWISLDSSLKFGSLTFENQKERQVLKKMSKIQLRTYKSAKRSV